MADDDAQEQMTPESENGAGRDGLSRLLNKNILIPATATAVTAAAAGLAATKGQDLVNKVLGEAKDGAKELGKEGAAGAKEEITGGGVGGLLGGAAKLLPGKGGGQKNKKTRRLPIQRWTDVAVPVEQAYEKWTNFEEFPKFMHRVLKVEQKDDTTVDWEEKIWFSKRQWQAEITDQQENDRIAWKTVSGTSHSGIVSFHRLDDQLTRVLVTVDFEPAGMFEKMASGLRFAKRAVQADLARFKAYAEFGEAEGLEYDAERAKDDQKDEKEADEGENEEQRVTSESSNGSGADPEQREAERRERDERRKERREALSAS